ncbi:PEPxxWA-CTERM sorting domain-containing protein [Phenylobacterium sp.]|uniref:PEPxxWA-CTERM sorting domain-containing protein n=1 Tax=Phenylobacterium sp. TaxID=1871053 RepID=UPI002732C84F|nr:PEPxxWA-CTERM sorting domain-containing protein [Phenylobacterium sp.]MDP3855077.1 PEPxxWA-CTERM sorting domain-containing protein [Phenylobacterium sp.]
MKYLAIATFAAGLALASAADAAVFIVDAKANSSSGGVGASSIALIAGQNFTVSVDSGDLWNAGALPRWSNADGLTGPLLATGSDDSGQAAGTLIGADFGVWSQNGLDAAYGTLVGELGGVFKVLGTSFAGPAWGTGTLNLYYWDSNSFDNTEFISADISSAVPEPVTWAMMIVGFGLAGSALRSRGRGLMHASA